MKRHHWRAWVRKNLRAHLRPRDRRGDGLTLEKIRLVREMMDRCAGTMTYRVVQDPDTGELIAGWVVI